MAVVLWTLLAAVPVLLLLAVFLSRRRRYQLAARFPGPTLWLPGYGNLIDTILRYGTSGVAWVGGNHKRFGNVYRFWLGSELLIVLSDPDDIESVVTSPDLIDKAPNYALLWPWLGDGLLLLGGKKWHTRRKLLTPAFHFRILDQFMDVFNEKGAILESKLLAVAGSGPVDIRPFISRNALDVICETAMGTPVNAQIQEDSDYVKAVKTACAMIDIRHKKPWLANDFIFRLCSESKNFYSALDIMHGFTRQVVDSRKAELQRELAEATDGEDNEQGGRGRKVFIDHLITMHLKGEDLSDKDIFDEVNTFMFEGHDTTTTSMCFTLFSLAKHPEVQERLAAEVREEVGDQPLTTANLAKLKYLDAVIKESLRLYPSVPLFFRKCDHEFKLPSGYVIPAESTIMVNVFMAQRDEKNFLNPLEFDPDRFLSDNTGKSHFSYIPFSAGFRNCIGQKFAMLSMKATLARLVRSCRFLPGGATLDLDFAVVLTAMTGFHVVVERRQ